MLKIRIITIGKVKEKWLHEALAEYAKRLTSLLSIEWCLAKDEKGLSCLLLKEPHYICLDSQGEELDSVQFAKRLFVLFESHGSKLTFAIGGDTGLPDELKKKASAALSLSSLTYTHQMTRLIFVEQLYRAFQIAAGSKYHK